MPRAIHADCMFTGEELVRDACVIVERGEVLEAGPARALGGLEVERVQGTLMPGLVNAHAHLELSALRGRVPGGSGFVPWVQALIAARTALEPDDSVEEAARELDRSCTTAVGEVTNTLAAVPALREARVGGRVFHEVFGLGERARERAEALVGWEGGDLEWSPAPHTLYTTELEVVRALLARADRSSIHLLEHPGERRALEHGDGPVADWLKNAWPKRPVLELAREVGALRPEVALVHLTEATPAELREIAASGAPVILCPRSNLFISVKLPPVLEVRAAGIAPALGTDSLASNTSLDVMAEARSVHERFPAIPALELLQMVTRNGARALGRSDLGIVARGARPGLALYATTDPLEIVKKPSLERRWVERR